MEKFKISGKELRNYYGGSIPLGTIIEELTKEMMSIGMEITGYALNDQWIGVAQIESWLDFPLEKVETFEYEAIESDEAIQEMLKIWQDAVQELDQRRRLFAKGLSTQGGFFPLNLIGDLVGKVEELESYLADLGIRCSQAPNSFSMTARSIETKDLDFLAKILEDDMKNYLQHYHSQLLKAQGKADGRTDRTAQRGNQSDSGRVDRRRLSS